MSRNNYTQVEETPVWELSHSLTILVYEISSNFPKSEIYGLTSQIRRSASSVPANITEGFYRNSTKELIQYLYNARGSNGETIYHLRLSLDLKYIDKDQYDTLSNMCFEIGKQLNGWIKSLKTKINH